MQLYLIEMDFYKDTLCSKVCCCCSVAEYCLTLWDPMDCSTPGFPVLHYLPELAQIHVRWGSDAIQPSHPCHTLFLLPSIFLSIGIFSMSQFFTSCGQSIGSLNFSISLSSDCSGLISFRMDGLDLLAVPGTLLRVFSNITVQKHQVFNAQLSL